MRVPDILLSALLLEPIVVLLLEFMADELAEPEFIVALPEALPVVVALLEGGGVWVFCLSAGATAADVPVCWLGGCTWAMAVPAIATVATAANRRLMDGVM